MLNKIFDYIKESKLELKKVSWPTKKAVFNYTLAVIMISLTMAAFLALADYILTLSFEKVIIR